GKDVVLTGDANIPGVITGSAVVLVGADTVLPDGSVINKVGTRAAMLAAASAGAERVVVCARDKIAPEPFELDAPERPAELFEGKAPIEVRNPVFERVPADLVDRIVTEEGALAPDEVAPVAAEHRRLAEWDQE
ncbi:MAG: initiation factor 2B, partial [Halodesulfurarchaeum sp.]